MTKRLVKYAAVAAMTAMLAGCEMVSSFLHDDDVVARVGKHRLYYSELRAFIPEGVSSLDSTNLALAYIDSWATDLIFNDKAIEQLSKEDQDVTAEIEAYRRSLLRFRYEQHYIADRLDTLVSEDQIQEFYDSHPELFALARPILKVRFVDIYDAAEEKETIIKKMGSNKDSDILEAEYLAQGAAIRYFDSSDTWMDALLLAREFGTDYGTMLASMNKNYITLDDEDHTDVKVAYVCEIKRTGVAPLEFCYDRVKDYILNSRKREILVSLERRLLQEARDNGHLVIY